MSVVTDEASEDIIDVIHAQHGRIDELFAVLEEVPPAEQRAAFDDLRSFLAMHEAAEEVVLRRATHTRDVSSVLDARNAEEKDAAALLRDLEKAGVDDPRFPAMLRVLHGNVRRHAANEESFELPSLDLDAEERVRLGKRFLLAARMAPTHPHPSVTGSPAAVAALGPFASLLDRARDAIRELVDDGDADADLPYHESADGAAQQPAVRVEPDEGGPVLS
ncbi:MAG: hemerythrin domain-containing protein [Candidatus Nanopelagicales bacterium]